MAKKKDKAAPAANTDKPKAKRKPRDPNAVVLPWAVRQLKTLAKLLKTADKLAKRFTKANTPGDAGATMATAVQRLQEVGEALAANAEFTPKAHAVGNKPKVGDTINLVANADKAKIFDPKYGLTPALFAGAVIVDDDRVYWICKCADGNVRAIAKKLAERA